MKAIEHRVAKLEQDAPAVSQCYIWIWANVGETGNQAVARQFPDGPPGDATMTIFRFAEPPDDGRPGRAVP
jgi:hypothetical protein